MVPAVPIKRVVFICHRVIANMPPAWTHALRDELEDQADGRMQRMSAFRVYRRDVDNAKKTFIIGSAGEMHWADTNPSPNPSLGTIETDLLILNENATSLLFRHGPMPAQIILDFSWILFIGRMAARFLV